jgi:hypothetical protein
MPLDKRLLLGLLTILFCIALGYSAVNSYVIHYLTVSEVIAELPIDYKLQNSDCISLIYGYCGG